MRIRRTKKADMSPAAVAKRLYDLASLYELESSLRRARVLGPAEASCGPASPDPEVPPERT